MGVYKNEASQEEMGREAVRRMELLKLEPQVIRAFEEGRLYLSRQQGGQVLLGPADEEAQQRALRFEREYACRVYHLLRADTPIVGTCWSLLFVSPESSGWAEEQNSLKSAGLTDAYVHSELEEGIGEIMVAPQGGGLERLG